MLNKPANSLIVPLDKTLNRMPPSLCGRQVVGSSSLLTCCLRITENLQKRANEKLVNSRRFKKRRILLIRRTAKSEN